MKNKKLLFKRVFDSNRSDCDSLLDEDELPLASFVYDVACGEIQGDEGIEDDDDENDDDEDFGDSDSVISFDEKIEAAKENFERVVEVFKKTNKSKDNFLNSYQNWAEVSKSNIQLLKEFAEEMQTDKFNSDISRVVGGVVGAVGGILVGVSFLTPLAAITLPLVIGGGVTSALGGTVVAGTTGTEIVLMKKKLDKAKKLVAEEKEKFSSMAHWFSHPDELEKAIDSLLDYDIFKQIAEEMQKFLEKVDPKNWTVGGFKNEFKQVLKFCIGMMNKDGKIVDEFGDAFAPVVITFIVVVCLIRDHNRIVLDCVMITQRLALGLMSVLDLGVQAGQLVGGLLAKGATSATKVAVSVTKGVSATKLAASVSQIAVSATKGASPATTIAASVTKGTASAIAKIAVTEILIGLGVIIDVLNVIVSSIDIHKRTEPAHVKKIKEVAEKFENVFLFVESVYNETKKYKSAAKSDVTTIVVSLIPLDAGKADIKMAIKPYIPEEALKQVKLRKLPTNGNNWLVKVPTSDSKRLLRQTHLTIKGKNCVVTQ